MKRGQRITAQLIKVEMYVELVISIPIDLYPPYIIYQLYNIVYQV